MITLICRYELESAHRLSGGLPEGHRCRRPHGHTYKVALYIVGIPDEHGVVIEEADIRSVVWPVLKLADHNDLNTMAERDSSEPARLLADNPTVERVAKWIGHSLSGLVATASAKGTRLRLVRVTVQETEKLGAEWTPD